MSSDALTPMEGFTFGADPELFIIDTEGQPVGAEDFIPGTKDEPYKVNKGAVQVDGMAAEFNIDPASNFEEFNDNIVTVLKELRKFLPKGYSLSIVPSVTFSERVWDKASDTAKELGCTPDFNAWLGDVNPPPNPPQNSRTRCAGGHIHTGWTDNADMSDIQHIMNCRDLVKQLDWYLGGWALRMDDDKIRRSLYGKAGACRFKPYGVEYRVLSNFWITDKDRRLSVWNRLNKAIFDMRRNFLPDTSKVFNNQANNLLITSINESQRNIILEKQFRFPLQGASFN